MKTVHLGKAGVDADGSDICEYVCRVPVRVFGGHWQFAVQVPFKKEPR